MSSTFGRMLKITTFGESHGRAVGVVVEGVPSGISLNEQYIQEDLNRRKPGQSEVTTSRDEQDRVSILSGVFKGKTLGTPIAMVVENKSARPSDYQNLKEVYRPGHADYTYQAKYGIRDWRGGGRASGRETVARVAAGAVAKKILEPLGIKIHGYTMEIAGIRTQKVDLNVVEKNPVRAPDLESASLMEAAIKKAKQVGDSVGGMVEVIVKGCPPGLGDPVFDKLDAMLAFAVMSIGGIRGVEVGCGFGAARMKGSEFNDPYCLKDGKIRSITNNSGGILGGISTGEDILLRAAIRPPASISIPQKTVTVDGKEIEIEVKGRHDSCIVPRVIPVVEAMVSLVLADFVLIQKIYQP